MAWILNQTGAHQSNLESAPRRRVTDILREKERQTKRAEIVMLQREDRGVGSSSKPGCRRLLTALLLQLLDRFAKPSLHRCLDFFVRPQAIVRVDGVPFGIQRSLSCYGSCRSESPRR